MTDLSGIADFSLLFIGLAIFLGLAAFGWVSSREGERRAAILASTLAILCSLPFSAASALPSSVQLGLLGALAAVSVAAVVIWFLPIGSSIVEGGRPDGNPDDTSTRAPSQVGCRHNGHFPDTGSTGR